MERDGGPARPTCPPGAERHGASRATSDDRTQPVNPAARRYPFTPLLERMAEPSMLAVFRRLRISGDSYNRFTARGLTEVQADRYATRAGLLTYEVWPEMVDHLIADAQLVCASDGCDELFVPSRPWSKYCSPQCNRREAQRRYRQRPNGRARKQEQDARYRAGSLDYTRAQARRYYADNRDRLLAAQKERDRARRAAAKSTGFHAEPSTVGDEEVAA